MAAVSHRRHPVRPQRRHRGPRHTQPTATTAASSRLPDHGGRPALDRLPAAVTSARQLIVTGDTTAAGRLLGPLLDRLDYRWAPDDPVLVDACTLYAPITTGPRRLAIARYAYDAARRLHHDDHPRLLAATHALAAVLHAVGECRESVHLRSRLTTVYERLGLHSESLRVGAAIADCLHRTGRCEQAAETIGRSWVLWRLRPGDNGGHPTGAIILRVYVHVLHGCQRHDHLPALLDQAALTPLAGRASHLAVHGPLADTEFLARHQRVCSHRVTPAGQ